MRLNDLYVDNKRVFLEYYDRLKNLKKSTSRVISERKITIEIDDDSEISLKAKEEFTEKAKSLGNFNSPVWVEQLVNGMKQVGVQGLSHVADGDHPVTRSEIKQLVELLVNLVNSK